MFNLLKIFNLKNDFEDVNELDLFQKRNLEFAKKMAEHLNLELDQKEMFINGIDFNFNTRGNSSIDINDLGLVTYVENEARSRQIDLDTQICSSILSEIDQKLGINKSH